MEPKAQKLKDFIENAGYNAYIAPDETVYCDALYLMGIKIDENGQYINKLSPEEKFNSPQEVLQELIIRSKDKAKRTYNYFSEHACSTNISLEKNIDFDYNIEKIILETNNNISKRQEIYKNILRLEYAIAIARIDKKINQNEYFDYFTYCHRIINGIETYNQKKYELTVKEFKDKCSD